MTWKHVIVQILLWCLHGISSVERDITFPIKAQTQECFFETALVGQIMELDYQIVDAGSDGIFAIDFSVIRPDGRPAVMEMGKAENTHQIVIDLDGDYKVCFDNTNSRSGSKIVFLELLLDNDGDEDYSMEFPGTDDYDQVEEMTSSIKIIKESISKSRRMQEQIRAHEFRDRSIAEHNFERVNFWSLVHMCILLTAGLVQVYVIRSIFDEKSHLRKIFN